MEFGELKHVNLRDVWGHTVETFAFFAVQVRVVQIADSPLVPLFDVLERPSAWERSVRETIDSERSEFRRQFWTHYGKKYPNDGVSVGYAGSSFWVWIESAGLNLAPYLAKGSVGVWVRGRRRESAEEVRERIQLWEQDLRDALGVEIGEGTSWGSYANSYFSADTKNRDNWSEMAEWLHNRISKYRRVLEAPPASRASNPSER